MKILAHVHAYPPALCAGGQMTVHTLLRDLVRRGHQARVLVPTSSGSSGTVPGGEVDVYEGVSLQHDHSAAAISAAYEQADLIVTHLDRTRDAIALCQRHRKPLVHVVHNHAQLGHHGVAPRAAQLVIFNSHWIRHACSDWGGRSLVCHPPIFGAEYRTTPGDRITLCNLQEEKGAHTFWWLAHHMTDHLFLAALGSYGVQVIGDAESVPANVAVQTNTPCMRDLVYARTRVLLMPSSYESYGRVALEAAASGIPTIAHPTAGLKEALGSAGIYADRSDVYEWKRELLALDDPATYAERSALARARSAEMDPGTTGELDAVAAAMEQTAAEWPRNRRGNR